MLIGHSLQRLHRLGGHGPYPEQRNHMRKNRPREGISRVEYATNPTRIPRLERDDLQNVDVRPAEVRPIALPCHRTLLLRPAIELLTRGFECKGQRLARNAGHERPHEPSKTDWNPAGQ